jgi:enamine deaminase RidA (YjgF/YER057c/UK114 family)
MSTPEEKLKELGIKLPDLPPPAGSYVHAVGTGNLLFLAGKGPNGVVGKVGADVSTAQAYEFAKQVGLQLLSVLRMELGSLNRVSRIVKVLGLVNATPDFTEHPKVINGCSDLMIAVFGEQGKHARTSLGVASLPHGIPVEIEAVVEVT